MPEILERAHHKIWGKRESSAYPNLTIVDNFSRVSPAIWVGRRARATDVVDTLNQAISEFGCPERIRVDNGSQFTSKELDLWAYKNRVILDFSRPGKPTEVLSS